VGDGIYFKGIDHLEDRLYGRIILKLIVNKSHIRAWTVFILYLIKKSGGLL
jgi:hypothetical protein